VKKAAVDLISKILSSTKSDHPVLTAHDGFLSDEDQKIITAVFAPVIMTDKGCDMKQLSVCLEILEKRDLATAIFSFLLLDRVQIVQQLCSLLKYLPTCPSCDNETKILEILASVCESYSCWNEARHDLVILVIALLNDGKILSAVAVAVWLLKRFVATYVRLNP